MPPPTQVSDHRWTADPNLINELTGDIQVTFPLASAGDQGFQPDGVANNALTLQNAGAAVNGLNLQGTATGVDLVLTVRGDPNRGLVITPRGTGAIQIGANTLLVPAGQGVDVAAAGALALGATTATSVLVGRTGQSIGFFGAAAVAQQAGATDVLASLVNLGLRAASANPPLNLGTGAINSGTVTTTGNVLVAAGQGIDTSAAGALVIGAATATSVALGRSTATLATKSNYAVGADVTASRNITGTNNTNGTNRRRCYVTVSLNAAAAGAAAATFTTTVGGTVLSAIEGAKVGSGLTQPIDFQVSFAVDPGATYSMSTILGTGATAALVKWIEVDE